MNHVTVMKLIELAADERTPPNEAAAAAVQACRALRDKLPRAESRRALWRGMVLSMTTTGRVEQASQWADKMLAEYDKRFEAVV